MIPPIDDTIAALATAPGPAGLAVLRLSGPRALAVADAVFRGATPLSRAAGHTLHHGWAVWPAAEEAQGGMREAMGAGAPASGHGDAESARAGDGRGPARSAAAPASEPDSAPPRCLDEVVAAVFRAPRSYTREDLVELSCHGGALPARRVLAALIAA